MEVKAERPSYDSNSSNRGKEANIYNSNESHGIVVVIVHGHQVIVVMVDSDYKRGSY